MYCTWMAQIYFWHLTVSSVIENVEHLECSSARVNIKKSTSFPQKKLNISYLFFCLLVRENSNHCLTTQMPTTAESEPGPHWQLGTQPTTWVVGIQLLELHAASQCEGLAPRLSIVGCGSPNWQPIH